MGSSIQVERYSEDALPAYTPMPWWVGFRPSRKKTLIKIQRSLKEIRAAIPEEFFIRDTPRGLLYFARDALLATVAWTLATYIDPYFQSDPTKERLSPIGAELGRWAAWGAYWWFQGLIFTGIWVIGHEVWTLLSSSPQLFT